MSLPPVLPPNAVILSEGARSRVPRSSRHHRDEREPAILIAPRPHS